MTEKKDETSFRAIWGGSLIVWALLLALLALTLVLAFVPLGGWNGPVSYGIGVAKAVLVVVIYMRLRKSAPISILAALAGLVWLATLFSMTFTDYPFRQAGERVATAPSDRAASASTDLPR